MSIKQWVQRPSPNARSAITFIFSLSSSILLAVPHCACSSRTALFAFRLAPFGSETDVNKDSTCRAAQQRLPALQVGAPGRHLALLLAQRRAQRRQLRLQGRTRLPSCLVRGGWAAGGAPACTATSELTAACVALQKACLTVVIWLGSSRLPEDGC